MADAFSSAFNTAFNAGQSTIRLFEQRRQFEKAQDLKEQRFENEKKQKRLSNTLAFVGLIDDDKASTETKTMIADVIMRGDFGIDPKGILGKEFKKLVTSKDPKSREVAKNLLAAAASNPEELAQISKAIDVGDSVDVAGIIKTLSTRLQSAPTGAEQKTTEKAAQVKAKLDATSEARAKAVAGRQATTSKREALEGSKAFELTRDIEVQGKVLKKGQRITGNFNKDTRAVETGDEFGSVAIPRDAVVPARLEGKAVGRPTAAQKAKERVGQFETLGQLEAVTTDREATRRLPEGAFGARGNVSRIGGRLFRELGSFVGAPEVGEEFAKKVSGGASLTELRRIGVQFRAQIAQSIEQITGEQSGRISEPERELTEKATGLMSSLASKDELLEVQFLSQQLGIMKLRRTARAQGNPVPLPIDPENIGNTLDILKTQFKMTDQEAQATAVFLARQDRFFSLIDNVLR